MGRGVVVGLLALLALGEVAMGVRTVENLCEVEVGPCTNFGVVQRQGFVLQEAVSEQWDRYEHLQHVFRNRALEAMHLEQRFAFTSLAPADVTVVAGTAPDAQAVPGEGCDFLWIADDTANRVHELQSAVGWAASPTFRLVVRKTLDAPPGNAPREFWFAFGMTASPLAGYRLEWGEAIHPRIVDISTGATVATYTIQEGDSERYLAPSIEWRVMAVHGRLFITSSAFSGCWTVTTSESGGITVGAGPWVFRENGGMAWIHAECYTFAPYGSWDTGFVDHLEVFQPGDVPETAVYPAADGGAAPASWQAEREYAAGSIIVPSVANGCRYRNMTLGISGAAEPDWSTDPDEQVADGTCAWEVVTDQTGYAVEVLETDGRRRNYRIHLYGTGASTPIVQAYRISYDPDAYLGSEAWTPLPVRDSRWGVRSVSFEWDEDRTKDSLRVTLVVPRRFREQWALFAQTYPGQMTIRASARYRYEDGSEDPAGWHFLGYVRDVEEQVNSRGTLTVTLVCYTVLAKVLDQEWVFPPAFFGRYATYALADILRIGGVPNDLVTIVPGGGDIPDPQWGYKAGVWWPRMGQRLGDTWRAVCEGHGVAGVCDIPFGITVGPRTLPADSDAVDLSSTDIDPAGEHLQTLQVRQSFSGARNATLGEGVTPEGRPCFALESDADSIDGTGRHAIGTRAVHYLDLRQEARTTAAVEEQTAKAHLARDAGWLTATVGNNADLAAWRWRPDQAFRLVGTGTRGDGVAFRVTRVSAELRGKRHACTLEGKEIAL